MLLLVFVDYAWDIQNIFAQIFVQLNNSDGYRGTNEMDSNLTCVTIVDVVCGRLLSPYHHTLIYEPNKGMREGNKSYHTGVFVRILVICWSTYKIYDSSSSRSMKSAFFSSNSHWTISGWNLINWMFSPDKVPFSSLSSTVSPNWIWHHV